MRTHRIVDRSYFRDIVLLVGTDAELERWCRRKHSDLAWNGVSGRYIHLSGESTHYLLISTKHRGAWKLGVLAHEVLHLTFAVLTDAGIQFSEGSEEAFTYFFQAMFVECVKKL